MVAVSTHMFRVMQGNYGGRVKPIPTKHPPSLIGGSVRSTMMFDPSPVPILMLGRAELDPTVTQARATAFCTES